MRIGGVLLFTLLLCAFLVFSCVGFDESGDTGIETVLSVVRTENIIAPYSIKSLLIPVVQYFNFNRSIDYFDQFIWGDDFIFVEYLSLIFGLEVPLFEPGQGVVLTHGEQGDETYRNLEIALLSEEADGFKMWQIRQDSPYNSLFYEVYVSPEGIPMDIRFFDPETDEASFSIFYDKQEFVSADAMFLEMLEDRVESDLSFLANNPQILGEEQVETPAGIFTAVHMEDLLPDNTLMNYWLSPDIPVCHKK